MTLFKTLFFACLLTALAFTAKAQYADMPQPIMAKNVAAYTVKKLSFAPDSRHVAAEYEDVAEKAYTTIVEIATGKELSPSQAGYPWKETESTKYKMEKDNIADKATGKMLYGIDQCVRERFNVSNQLSLAPDNTMVAVITQSGVVKATIGAYASAEFTFVIEAALGKKDESSKQKIEDYKKRFIALGDGLAQIEIFKISELPKYHPSLNLTDLGMTGDKEYMSCVDLVGGEFAKLTKNGVTDIYHLPTMNKVQAPQGYELFGNPYFNEGVAVVKKDSKYGLMDLKTNKIVLPCNFKSVFCVAKQKALVLTDKGGAIIDLQTQKSVWEKEGGFMDFRRNVKLFDEVLLVAIPSAKHQLIKPENGQVIGEYAEISLYPLRSPTDKMLISAKNTAGKWGVIDTQNKVVIPFDYDEFYGGLVGGSWEDKNDKGELLKVKKGSFWGAIDYTNKTVIPFEYEDINYVGELGVIFVGKGGKKGVLSKRNEVLVPVKYDEIAAVYYQKIDGEIKGFSLPSGILQVEVGKKVGLYSTTLKKELVAPQYREFQNITPNSAECVGFDGKITKIQF